MDVGGKLRRFSVFEDKRGHYVIFIRIREFHHTPITLSQQFGATEQTTSSRIAKQDKPRQRFTNLVFRSRTSYPKVFSNPIYYGGSNKFITGELFLPTRQIFLAPKQLSTTNPMMLTHSSETRALLRSSLVKCNYRKMPSKMAVTWNFSDDPLLQPWIKDWCLLEKKKRIFILEISITVLCRYLIFGKYIAFIFLFSSLSNLQ